LSNQRQEGTKEPQIPSRPVSTLLHLFDFLELLASLRFLLLFDFLRVVLADAKRFPQLAVFGVVDFGQLVGLLGSLRNRKS
jgi:hypothetical protein